MDSRVQRCKVLELLLFAKKHKPPVTCATDGLVGLDAEPRPLVPLHLEFLTVCRFSQ